MEEITDQTWLSLVQNRCPMAHASVELTPTEVAWIENWKEFMLLPDSDDDAPVRANMRSRMEHVPKINITDTVPVKFTTRADALLNLMQITGYPVDDTLQRGLQWKLQVAAGPKFCDDVRDYVDTLISKLK